MIGPSFDTGRQVLDSVLYAEVPKCNATEREKRVGKGLGALAVLGVIPCLGTPASTKRLQARGGAGGCAGAHRSLAGGLPMVGKFRTRGTRRVVRGGALAC